ncbi:hypothetical protein GCM10023205_77770 [Yinghuangia aomiensis]|uniref:Uncharacterized protein n=1 Tax=Yinghuangia aomiensis TaxID=676205 RepID=A0ABP9IDB9_9ACTN
MPAAVHRAAPEEFEEALGERAFAGTVEEFDVGEAAGVHAVFLPVSVCGGGVASGVLLLGLLLCPSGGFRAAFGCAVRALWHSQGLFSSYHSYD